MAQSNMQMMAMPGYPQQMPEKSHLMRNIIIGCVIAVVVVLVFDLGGIRTKLSGSSQQDQQPVNTLPVNTGIVTNTDGTITVGTGGAGTVTVGTGNTSGSTTAPPVITAPVILYSEPNFGGTATPIVPGRTIKLATIGPGCDGKWGSLGCWSFLYKSMKADPSVNLIFRRSSSGNNYALTLDPAQIGNIDTLDADYLEAFVPPGSYSNSDAMSKTAVLPYVYWTDPLYLQVLAKTA